MQSIQASLKLDSRPKSVYLQLTQKYLKKRILKETKYYF